MALLPERVPGREPIVIVEIDQDRCTRTYGVAPCTAAVGVTGTRKCFNTLATCQDAANFVAGTLTLRFCRPGETLPRDITLIPSVKSVTTRPTRINVGVGDDNYGALGRRAEVTVTFQDHPHRDLLVDPYPSTRDYDPLARGTFWTKWLARNPYYQNRAIRIREGYVGQDLGDMNVRHYLIDRIEGPDGGGMVRLVGRDVLKLADDKRATAPRASNGRLAADIDVVAAALTLVPAGIGDDEYPAEGYGRVGGELVSFTRVADAVSITARGLRGTDAEAHSEGDAFQIVLTYESARVEDVIRELLVDYGNVPDIWIPFTDWQAEAGVWLGAAIVSTWLTEPIGVQQLVGELCEQYICSIWWDERLQEIRFRALRPPSPATDEVTELGEEAEILADSLAVRDDPDQRLSQVWIFYDQINPTKAVDDGSNYNRLRARVDFDAETAIQYGEQRIRKIFSRWLTDANDGQVLTTGARLLARYRDNPRQVNFALDAKDRALWTGDIADLTHRSIVDDTGAPLVERLQIISAEETDPGHRAEYLAQSYYFTGNYAYIVADDAPDYGDADAEEREFGAWIAPDADGFADGTEPYRFF